MIPNPVHSDRPFVGALGLRVRNRAIGEVSRISHPGLAGVDPAASSGTPIRRSVVVGGGILHGLGFGREAASALETFADLGFARLPRGTGGTSAFSLSCRES